MTGHIIDALEDLKKSLDNNNVPHQRQFLIVNKNELARVCYELVFLLGADPELVKEFHGGKDKTILGIDWIHAK